MIDHSQNSLLFIKFLKSSCNNLKNDIESLLTMFLNWISNTEYQKVQSKKLLCNQCNKIIDQFQPESESQIGKTDFNVKDIPNMNSIQQNLQKLSCYNISKNQKLDFSESIIDNNYHIKNKIEKEFNSIVNNHSNINDTKEINLKLKLEKLKSQKLSISNKSSFDLLDHLKKFKDLDFDPVELTQISRDRAFQKFQKKQKGNKIQRYFKFKKSNVDTNLFIQNEIQKNLLIELNVNINEQDNFLKEINIKYDQKLDE